MVYIENRAMLYPRLVAGSIPATFGNLTQLMELKVYNNTLTGEYLFHIRVAFPVQRPAQLQACGVSELWTAEMIDAVGTPGTARADSRMHPRLIQLLLVRDGIPSPSDLPYRRIIAI